MQALTAASSPLLHLTTLQDPSTVRQLGLRFNRLPPDHQARLVEWRNKMLEALQLIPDQLPVSPEQGATLAATAVEQLKLQEEESDTLTITLGDKPQALQIIRDYKGKGRLAIQPSEGMVLVPPPDEKTVAKAKRLLRLFERFMRDYVVGMSDKHTPLQAMAHLGLDVFKGFLQPWLMDAMEGSTIQLSQPRKAMLCELIGQTKVFLRNFRTGQETSTGNQGRFEQFIQAILNQYLADPYYRTKHENIIRYAPLIYDKIAQIFLSPHFLGNIILNLRLPDISTEPEEAGDKAEQATAAERCRLTDWRHLQKEDSQSCQQLGHVIAEAAIEGLRLTSKQGKLNIVEWIGSKLLTKGIRTRLGAVIYAEINQALVDEESFILDLVESMLWEVDDDWRPRLLQQDKEPDPDGKSEDIAVLQEKLVARIQGDFTELILDLVRPEIKNKILVPTEFTLRQIKTKIQSLAKPLTEILFTPERLQKLIFGHLLPAMHKHLLPGSGPVVIPT